MLLESGSTKRQRQVQSPVLGPRSDFLLVPDIDSLNTSALDPGTLIEHHLELKPRQANPNTSAVSTCGYLNGNGALSRTAEPGFDCRVDAKNALWGFCPTTVISPSDCGFGGDCVDAHVCSSGCGIIGNPSLTTFTWCVRTTLPLLLPPFHKPDLRNGPVRLRTCKLYSRADLPSIARHLDLNTVQLRC